MLFVFIAQSQSKLIFVVCLLQYAHRNNAKLIGLLIKKLYSMRSVLFGIRFIRFVFFFSFFFCSESLSDLLLIFHLGRKSKEILSNILLQRAPHGSCTGRMTKP